jgi:amidase
MRPRLAAAALLLALPALTAVPSSAKPGRHARPAGCADTVRGVDLQHATILDLQRALAARRLTSADLVRAYLARVATFDHGPGKLNSIRALNPHALAQAKALDAERRHGHVRGPLHGIPILLKDNVGTTDMPTTAGSIALAGSVPKHDADVTARLRQAGAIILGKTNLSEFANWVDLDMPNGYSSLGGQVVNPYTLGDPSGSSSGSGVAGTMAFAAAAIGTETSGSILSPSDANSLVGVKPTHGLVKTDGVIPLAPSFDVPGPMARTVTDVAVLLDVIAKGTPGGLRNITMPAHLDFVKGLRRDALRGVRLGVPATTGSGESGRLFADAIATLERLGATIVRLPQGWQDARLASASELGLIPNEFKWSLNEYLANEARPTTGVKTLADIVAYNDKHPDKVKYGQRLLVASNASPGVGPLADAGAVPVRTQAQAMIDGLLAADDLDAIVELGPGNANVGAAAGYPTVIVPAGYTGEVTPTGLAFTGTALSDPKLVAYAYAFEQATHKRVPPTVLNRDLYPAACR